MLIKSAGHMQCAPTNHTLANVHLQIYIQTLLKILSLLIITELTSSCVTTPSTTLNLKTAAQINKQLGLEYLQRKQWHLAKQKLLRAIQLDPDSPEIQEAMGYYFLTLGETKVAQLFYDTALQKGEKNGAIQNNYGIFLCRIGHYEESIQHFLTAANNLNYLNTAQAYQNASFCAAQIPNFELALFYTQKAQNNTSL